MIQPQQLPLSILERGYIIVAIEGWYVLKRVRITCLYIYIDPRVPWRFVKLYSETLRGFCGEQIDAHGGNQTFIAAEMSGIWEATSQKFVGSLQESSEPLECESWLGY